MNNKEFRVFSKTTRRYLTPTENPFVVIESTQDLLYPNAGTFLNNPNYRVEQFTGILDKNKCKIFEGDLVKYKRYHFQVEKNELGESEKIIVEDGFDEGVVEYIAPSYRLVIQTDHFYSCEQLSNESKRLEIIGNVNNKKIK
jgi:uncharacterized phage protein (TIGR01671 family)